MEMSFTEKQKNVLQALQAGKHLTVLTAIRECHTTELRKIVCRLRDQGYVIRTYQNPGEKFKHYFLENVDKKALNVS